MEGPLEAERAGERFHNLAARTPSVQYYQWLTLTKREGLYRHPLVIENRFIYIHCCKLHQISH